MSQENISSKQPLIRYVNRQQMSWQAVDVERLIGEDHPARAIWALVGRLDLRGFYQSIENSTEEGGRPAFDPQLLISLWLYAYSRGIGSAREVAPRRPSGRKSAPPPEPTCMSTCAGAMSSRTRRSTIASLQRSPPLR